MHKFHYDYIKNKYGNKAKLLLTDINSFAYEIKHFMKTKIISTLVIIQKTQNIMIWQTIFSLVKWKMQQKKYHLLSLLTQNQKGIHSKNKNVDAKKSNCKKCKGTKWNKS